MKNNHLAGAVALGVLVLLGLGLYKFLKPIVSDSPGVPSANVQTQTPPKNAIQISIASSNTKQDWLHQAAESFNKSSKANANFQIAGRPIFVEILQETIDGKKVDYRSGTMVSDTIRGKIKPTVLSPGEESWIDKFKNDWQVANNSGVVKGDSPVLVRTPLVIAMWESRAKALGCWPESKSACTWDRVRALAQNPQGWRAYNRPEWGKFTFGYGYFGESNSGTLGVISMCMSGARKMKGIAVSDVGVEKPCGQIIAAVESAKVHSGKSDIWLLELMIQSGPEYLDAVITYESNVILMNKKHAQTMREPLVSVYPQDGTVVVGHPFAILDGASWVTPEQAAAAKVFGNFLLSKEEQEAVLSLGLRPADKTVKLSSPIEVSFGANAHSQLVTLEVPDTLVIERIGEVWHKVKKRAVVVLVFDKSGSMKDSGKIGAAIKGAQAFVDFMELNDSLAWMPFDGTVYADRTYGTKSEIGETLKESIRSTNASGGTALYDAVTIAFSRLEELRKKHGDAVRYGMVVLSDGADTQSKSSLTDVEIKLKPEEGDPRGFQIHTICIGSDCNENVLKKIAKAAHGKYWKGNTHEEMVKVYKEIAAHY